MPGGAGTEHPGDQRHDARHHHLLAEQVARAREHRAGRLLDPGAGRVEQPDQRHPLLQRQLAQARHLDLAGHPHRAGHHGEVVGGDRDGAPVDVAPAGDHPVGRRLLAVHRALREVRAGVDAHLDEGARVDEQVDPLARGQLAGGVLLGDLLLAPAELRLLAALVEVVDRAPSACRSFAGGASGASAVLRGRRHLLGLGCFAHPYLPFHTGSRFSKNAVTPSIASSVESSIVSCERR